jgi:hypothetical protein
MTPSVVIKISATQTPTSRYRSILTPASNVLARNIAVVQLRLLASHIDLNQQYSPLS